MLSNESISLTFIHDNRLDIFCSLRTVLQNCDIKLLISLRSPVDFMFSLFVQEVYDSHFYKYHKNFEQFATDCLNNSTDYKTLTFKYNEYLQLVDEHFDNKTVLLFEDLKHDKECYFNTLAALLGLDKNDIQQKFLVKKRNTKVVTRIGKVTSEPATLGKLLDIRIKPLTKVLVKFTLLKLLLSRSWRRRLLFRLLNFKVGIGIKHPFPNAQLTKQLSDTFGIKDIDEFARQHNLDKAKLIKYNYGKE